MLKRDELTNPDSCLNKATDDEPIFVLRGKDIAAYETIRCWCKERVFLGKNKPNDPQLIEASKLAIRMQEYWVKYQMDRMLPNSSPENPNGL